MGYYNRYSEFIEDGDFVMVPTIVLEENTSDKEVLYKVGRSRMDKISQQVNSNFDDEIFETRETMP